MPYFHKATPIDDNGVIRCYEHGLRASLKTSHSERNPERSFYSCPKDMNDPERCRFFCWADDPILGGQKSLQATPSLSPHSQRKSMESPVPPTTPSLKRHHDASTESQQQQMTPSQKRLRIMEDALSSVTNGGDVSPSQKFPSTPESRRKRLFQIESALSSAIKPHPSGMHVNSSANGDEEYRTYSLGNRDQAQTKELPIIPSSAEILSRQHETETETDEEAKLWALLTPPSSFEELDSDVKKKDSDVEPIHPSRKGKERAIEDDIRWCPNDPENPFEGSSFSKFQLDSSANFSADLVSSLLTNLNVIPDYLRKLERQRVVADKINQAKANRIFELEEEISRLKLNKQTLEETIKTLKLRH